MMVELVTTLVCLMSQILGLATCMCGITSGRNVTTCTCSEHVMTVTVCVHV